MKFEELNLPKNIMSGLKKMGFEEMTPIQELSYPIISAGQDMCALAETGSGKTAACVIPLIQKIDVTSTAIQGLVIVPTRELCLQYVSDIQKIGGNADIIPFGVYGGFSREIQKGKLRHGVHILVATPGRLIDLLYEGIVELSDVRVAILDEADELLNEGFFNEIKLLLSCIIHEHQTILFSATMPDDIRQLVGEVLHDPEFISLISKRAAPASIQHYFKFIKPGAKLSELQRLIEEDGIRQAIIFCNARHLVDKLFRDLRSSVKDIDYIHGGLQQEKRSSIIRKFRREAIRCLIATDVAGRGLDFSHVSHVINWDFPAGGEQYTHRTGRAGRMGRDGKALSFITRRDLPALRKLIRFKKISPVWIGEDPLQNQDSSGNRNSGNRKASHRNRKKKYTQGRSKKKVDGNKTQSAG